MQAARESPAPDPKGYTVTMTNRERASAWLHAAWPSRQLWPSSAADSLAAMLDEVRDDALRDAAAVCNRRSDELAARPQGPNWQSVEFTTAANEIRRLAEPLRPLGDVTTESK